MTHKPESDATGLVRSRPEDFGFSRFAPRIWHGMTFGALMRMLKGNWRKVSFGRYGAVASALVLSVGSSLLKAVSQIVFERRVQATKINPDPVFVIGHPRSGTTWLHQILASDPTHVSPTAIQCFTPETFLITQVLLRPVMGLILPSKRPMDNMAMSKSSAEEDEFAITISGAKSPYAAMAFPCDEDGARVFNPAEMPARDRDFFRKTWIGFLKRVQFMAPDRRLLLKSPGHSLRIQEILLHFPNAKFIYIVRNPYSVFMSGQKMQAAMLATQSLQTMMPDADRRRVRILKSFKEFTEKYETSKNLIPDGNLFTVKYENLKADPKTTIQRIYQQLELGEFAKAEAAVDAIIAERKAYIPNAYDFHPDLEAEIFTTLQAQFERYEYERQIPETQQVPS